MFIENSNEVNEILKNYTNNLMNSRPDFLKMIYDSYAEFDFEELETAITANLSEKSLGLGHSNKAEKKSASHRGFYTTFEQFVKGYEHEKWLETMGKVLKNVKLNNSQQIKDKTPPEIKQFDFMRPEEAPKRPEWKFNQNLMKGIEINLKNQSTQNTQQSLNFNFKTKDTKILSFANTANFRQEKLQNYIKEIFMSKGGDQIIKLVDTHRDNKITFVEKIETDDAEDGEPLLNGVIDLKSLEKRADILVNSRLSFIDKVATIVCKFVISLKKLYKNKKEKEKQRTLHGVNSVHSLTGGHKEGYSNFVGGMAQSASGGNIIKEINEKLKRVREIISSRSIKTILNSNNSKSAKAKDSNLDLKKFKKILNKKVENKEKMLKTQKLNTIKEKIKKAIEQEDLVDNTGDEDRFDDESHLQEGTYNEEEDLETTEIHFKKSLFDPDKNKSSLMHSEDAFETPVKSSQAMKKRKIVVQNTQILDMVKDLAEEKVIMPKKKLNHSGLKMFIKDELSKINKK